MKKLVVRAALPLLPLFVLSGCMNMDHTNSVQPELTINYPPLNPARHLRIQKTHRYPGLLTISSGFAL